MLIKGNAMIKIILLSILIEVSLAFSITAYGPYESYIPSEAYFAFKAPKLQTSGYAYGPATVYYNGVFHQFYCSTGGRSDPYYIHPDENIWNKTSTIDKTWDHIRYRSSKNGHRWSTPRIALTQTISLGKQNELCTCDPALIKDGNFWYLYYTGILENRATAVYVARSKQITGPFLRLTKRGTWEEWAVDPKPILYSPKIIGKNSDGTYKSYGVGQQSVVKKGDEFHFWFQYAHTSPKLKFVHVVGNSAADTTIQHKKWTTITLDQDSIFSWDEGTQNDFGDVKLDPSTNKFNLWMTSNYYTVKDIKILKYESSDGITWTKTSDNFKGPYQHINNLGVSGDSLGKIINNKYLLSFGGPVNNLNLLSNSAQCQSTKDIYACFPWSMWEIMVNGRDSNTQKIDTGYVFPFCSSNLQFLNGDFDGDGVADLAAVDKSTGKWYIRSSKTNTKFDGHIPWGTKLMTLPSSYALLTGDYDGDGKTDVAIVNKAEGKWYIKSSKYGNGTPNFTWGYHWSAPHSCDTYLAGDYDGDGYTDLAAVDRAAGNWYILSGRTKNKVFINNLQLWGWNWLGMTNGFDPVVADFDGDGKTDRAIVNKNSGEWFIISSNTGRFFKHSTENIWGYKLEPSHTNITPVMGDFDGDGHADLAYVFPFNGAWIISGSYQHPKFSGRIGNSITWSMPELQKNALNHQILNDDYDGDGINDIGFVETKTCKVYLYSSYTSKKGINTKIYQLYSNTEVLAKHKESDFNIKDINEPTITEQVPNSSIAINGRILTISKIQTNDRIDVINSLGQKIYSGRSLLSEVNIQIPTPGMYILRVGKESHKISVK